jgi:hypothetical protein
MEGYRSSLVRATDNLTYPYDTERQLRTEEERSAYLEAALEDGEPQLIAAAREDVARSRSLFYTYELAPRPAEVGGGWRLRLLELGQEVGGGVFPPEDTTKEALDEAYGEAMEEGEAWLAFRPEGDTLED